MPDFQQQQLSDLNKPRPESLKDSFNKTNLDLENPNPLGGPNRTNSSQIPNGIYSTAVPGNYPWQAPSPGGVLKNKEGEIVETQLQRWTKDNKYLDSFNSDGSQTS